MTVMAVVVSPLNSGREVFRGPVSGDVHMDEGNGGFYLNSITELDELLSTLETYQLWFEADGNGGLYNNSESVNNSYLEKRS